MVKKIDKISSYFLVGILLVFFSVSVFARGPSRTKYTAFNKPSATDLFIGRSLSNIGNWAYWVTYDGMSGHDPIADASGGTYPRQTATAIFQDGFVWGGFATDGVSPAKRVGGATYAVGTQAGYIVTPGPNPIAVSLPNDLVTIYRIRSDWRTLTPEGVRVDAAEVNSIDPSKVTEDQLNTVLQQYKDSWKNWPVDLGAPYIDGNNNGVYDPVLDDEGYPIERPGDDYPGIANADQVVWYVVNDLDAAATAALYGSPPLGLELQITLWAYKQPGAALGQLIFKKYKFINKSGYDIDSMFVSQWCDPDLGNYSDDFVGCDTLLSLGYCYNSTATDAQYSEFNLAPPAIGYDFFQGPIVESPGDTAIFDLKYKVGYKNLPMTSFAWFAAGSDIDDPPLGEYNGTLAWYNMLNGYIPTTSTILSPYVVGSGPGAGNPTKYPLAGDPVLNTGDIDGQGTNFPPGDRRMDLCSGPFTMLDGDTQEVVVAVVGGIGSDNLTSLSEMKKNDRTAQALYNALFATVPKPPASPNVKGFAQEDYLVLDWGFDHEAVALTESKNEVTGYDFEGYNVYQLPSPSASFDQAVKIATYDLIDGVTTIYGTRFIPSAGGNGTVPIQNGLDNGISRFIEIKKDYVNDRALNRNSPYYFSVTAYNYNPNPTLIEDKSLESSILSVTVIPQSPVPDTRYSNNALDLLDVEHTSGGSDGIVQAQVIDPSSLSNANYEVFFKDFQYITVETLTEIDTIIPLDTTYIAGFDSLGNVIITDTIYTLDTTYVQIPDSMLNSALGWNVRNEATGDVLVSNQLQASSIAERNNQPIFNGIQVKVSGPPLTLKDWGWEDGEPSPLYPDYSDGRWLSGADWGGAGLFGGLGMAHIFWGADPGIPPADFHKVEFRFTPMTAYQDTNQDGEYSFGAGGGEPYSFDTEQGQKAFMYQTFAAGTYEGFYDIPFQCWDVEDPNNPRQLNVIVRDRDLNTRWDQGTGSGPYNYVWVMADDYDPTGTAWDASTPENDFGNLLANGPGGGAVPAYYVLWEIARGSRPFLAEAGVLTAIPNHVITDADVFSFNTTAPDISNSLAKESVDKINVFPNPYYAFNPLETNRFDRFVTFSHLPKKATLRIFDLAGTQVRKLEKNSQDQFLQWDLKNEAGIPVASGIYIVYVDMPDISANKTLKVFIVQSDQILKYY